jgi:hypothetical protein
MPSATAHQVPSRRTVAAGTPADPNITSPPPRHGHPCPRTGPNVPGTEAERLWDTGAAHIPSRIVVCSETRKRVRRRRGEHLHRTIGRSSAVRRRMRGPCRRPAGAALRTLRTTHPRERRDHGQGVPGRRP